MIIYVVVDKETLTNVAVGNTWAKTMDKVLEQDVYFRSPADFFSNYQERYEVQEWEEE